MQRCTTGAQDARRRLLREHPESPVTARVWLPLANQAFEKSDFAQAVTIYTALESGLDAVQKGQLQAARILSEGANDPVPVLESARASMREREHRAALALLRVLRERFPRHPAAFEAAVLEGQCLVNLGDRENAERARDIWQRVVSQTGVDEKVMDLARWELIRVHSGPLGDIDSALRWCREAIEGSREGEFRHQQAVYSKAWLLWVHKRYEAALAAFEAFERAYPTEAATAPIQEYMQDCRDKIAK